MKDANSNIAATRMNIAATKKEKEDQVEYLQSVLKKANSNIAAIRETNKLLTSKSLISFYGFMHKWRVVSPGEIRGNVFHNTEQVQVDNSESWTLHDIGKEFENGSIVESLSGDCYLLGIQL